MTATHKILSLAFLLSACGSSAPAPARPALVGERPAPTEPANARGDTRASTYIGMPGGTLQLQNGGKLVVARGALVDPTEVSLSVGEESGAFNSPEDEVKLGPALRITPELVAANGATFTVSLPMPSMPDGFDVHGLAIAVETPQSDQRGQPGAPTRTSWHHFPARASDGRMIAELTSLPGYRIQFVVSR